jgi:hypothetical protein
MAVEMKLNTLGIDALTGFSIEFTFKDKDEKVLYEATIADTDLYGNPKTLIQHFP